MEWMEIVNKGRFQIWTSVLSWIKVRPLSPEDLPNISSELSRNPPTRQRDLLMNLWAETFFVLRYLSVEFPLTSGKPDRWAEPGLLMTTHRVQNVMQTPQTGSVRLEWGRVGSIFKTIFKRTIMKRPRETLPVLRGTSEMMESETASANNHMGIALPVWLAVRETGSERSYGRRGARVVECLAAQRGPNMRSFSWGLLFVSHLSNHIWEIFTTYSGRHLDGDVNSGGHTIFTRGKLCLPKQILC